MPFVVLNSKHFGCLAHPIYFHIKATELKLYHVYQQHRVNNAISAFDLVGICSTLVRTVLLHPNVPTYTTPLKYVLF